MCEFEDEVFSSEISGDDIHGGWCIITENFCNPAAGSQLTIPLSKIEGLISRRYAVVQIDSSVTVIKLEKLNIALILEPSRYSF